MSLNHSGSPLPIQQERQSLIKWYDVQGSNDKPIVSAWTQLPAGKEGSPLTIKASDLLAHASDVDSSDVLHVTKSASDTR
ncbi:cadherin-like domain-containing protein [Vibrio chagasii]|nr:cadherin-like domain-containing protein [Vibrio chagasii]